MADLSGKELYKYEWRVEVFLKKYKNKEPFELTNGKKVVFLTDTEVIQQISKKKPTVNIKLRDKTSKLYTFKDILKNSEFSGKGAGGGTIKEDRELESLIKQIDEAKKQVASSIIKVKVANKTYDVFTAASTSGVPKSDFHLVDVKGNEIVWISHKDGSRSKDFQQWGGISSAKEPLIFNHKETQKFISDIKNVYPKGLPPATTIYRHIKDNKLKMLSVYGNKFGGILGQQNVSMLLQGPVKLVKKGKYFVIKANHEHYNGDSVDGDGYDPVLMAIYKGDRSDAGIPGTRVVISPVGGRKGAEFK